LYDLLTSLRLNSGIELTGFPSLSTAYIAGALAELGGGHLWTIRRQDPKAAPYDIPKVLQQTNLLQYVDFETTAGSYNLRLLEFIARGQQETFDFCIVDREVSLSEVGFAVCLCERLLRPGGWIILSDMITPTNKHHGPNAIGNSQQAEPNVLMMLFQALEQNPYFASFQRRGCSGWAQKTESIWSAARRQSCEREAVICDLKLRAQLDPEFRLELLNDPHSALCGLPEHLQSSLRDLRFVESSRCFGRDVAGQICLGEPEWESLLTEDSLEEMIQQGGNYKFI